MITMENFWIPLLVTHLEKTTNMTKRKTYLTEDGHIKANCPQCEASEHPHILDMYGKCEICYYEEKREKKKSGKA